jgi:hypothetical protein
VTAERDAVIAEWVRRSRERQGLPARICDPVVLAKVATLLDAGIDHPDDQQQPA